MSPNKNAPPPNPGAHPKDELLRQDRIPHIWCPGCGIGSAVSACITALQRSGVDYEKFAVVSGIGCTGRVAGYLKLDSFHTTHGRAVPFATGLKLAKPELNVFVFSGEGDLFSIGGNHFIHAARRNMDLAVICVNNMNYGMTGGQVSANTPLGAKTTTSPHGNTDAPLNLPSLAAACGPSMWPAGSPWTCGGWPRLSRRRCSNPGSPLSRSWPPVPRPLAAATGWATPAA